uniref:ATP synthase F0 subunit 8 n=1 Tax=Nesophrosyne sp. 242 GMB-2012 TaxID=1223954 RepID=UPI0021823397|nr:ATP synthase F0 subunit 8 [Nesophrosyne sp. 242 GMB-2012]UVI59793.1 ATP synthase F0 subunit 8 [Nesophrosyne sp. 242 GMB-2012]
MPQMAPMWWTSILLTTSITLLLMMMINYFTSVKKINFNINKNSKNLKWKWY